MGPSTAFLSLQSPSFCFAKLPAASAAASQNQKKNPIATACMAAAPPAAPQSACLGFKNLMDTYTVNVQTAEGRALNVPLIAPFTIASSRLERVENVAIRVELSNGCVGWGEAPILPHVTAEDQPSALAAAAEACRFLKQSPGRTLGLVLGEIHAILPGHSFASVSSHFFFFSPFPFYQYYLFIYSFSILIF